MLGVMTLFSIVVDFLKREFLFKGVDVSVIASYLCMLMGAIFFVSGVAVAAPSLAPSQSGAGLCSGAPQEFRLSSQGAVYSCRKLACDGHPQVEPTAAPSLPAAPVAVQPFCDGAFRFLVRSDAGVISGGEFSARDRCQRAVEQFRTYKGCICGADFTPKCFASSGNKGVRFDEVGSGFTRLESCLKSLEQLQETVEVKAR